MKKYLGLCLVLCIALLSGCGSTKSTVKVEEKNPESYFASKYETKRLKIVDGAQSGNLILAGNESGYIYALDANSVDILADGKKSGYGDLEDGMAVDVCCENTLIDFPQETGVPIDITPFCKAINGYSIGTKENPGGTYYDLCGLYLKVLEDLWKTDDGLNHDIKYISVDLSNAPGGLTETEKSAIGYIFAKAHDKQYLNLSYEELVQKGYLKGDKPYYFEDGILFSITDSMKDYEQYNGLRVIKFDAQKWRSGLGADFFADCSAVWPQKGTWTDYNVGAHAIS